MPERWSIYIDGNMIGDRENTGRINWRRYVVLSNSEIAQQSPVRFLGGQNKIPRSSCSVTAVIYTDILPHGFVVSADGDRGSSSSFESKTARDWMSSEYIFREAMGTVWLTKLRQLTDTRDFRMSATDQLRSYQSKVNSQHTANVEILDEKVTRVKVEVPADLESRIQQLVDSITDPKEFLEAVAHDNPFVRRADIIVLSTEPLPE